MERFFASNGIPGRPVVWGEYQNDREFSCLPLRREVAADRQTKGENLFNAPQAPITYINDAIRCAMH